jgi:hypothetical protein
LFNTKLNVSAFCLLLLLLLLYYMLYYMLRCAAGAYTRLMSRCTVVDTAKLPPTPPLHQESSQQQQQQQMPASVVGQKNPFADTNTSSVEEQPQVEELEERSSSYNQPALSAKEQNEIDKMYSGLDDDFASSLSMDQKTQQTVCCSDDIYDFSVPISKFRHIQ